MQELEVLAAIDVALNDYALGMDLRDLDTFLGAWHPHGIWSISSAVGTDELYGAGHAAITDSLHALWDLEQQVMHATTNHQIVVESASRAKGQSHAVVLGVTRSGRFFIDLVVYPDDRFELRDGDWKLVYRRVDVGSHVEFEPEVAPVQLFGGSPGVFLPPEDAY